MEYFSNAFISSFISTTILHPIDTIKIYYQNNKIIRYNLRNLYKGYFIGLSYCIPEKTVKIATFDTLTNEYNYSIDESSSDTEVVDIYIIHKYIIPPI